MSLMAWLRETFKIVRPLPPAHVCAVLEAQERLITEAEKAAEASREYADRLDNFARFVRSIQGRHKIHNHLKEG